MRAADVLPSAIAGLRAAGVDDPPGDARRLLAFAMQVPPDRLTLHLADPLDPAAADRLAAALRARAARQPVSQIIGSRLFYGHTLRVTPDVLDPRPETETLVVAALSERFGTVLDLGTGSGAIVLSLLAGMPGSRGTGSDLSLPALAVAAQNAAALNLSDRCRFVPSDWFAAITGVFDLIVANPPYLAADEMAALAPEVRLWEPRAALTAGGDGLDAYRAIAAGTAAHLAPGGRLLVEIGPTQAHAVTTIVAAAGLSVAHVLPDLDGRSRVLIARAR